MIERFLSLYLKKLDEDAVELITRARGSDTPLFLSVILSELRVFGHFQEIKEQIQKFNGDTDAAFSEILAFLSSGILPFLFGSKSIPRIILLILLLRSSSQR